MLDRLASLFGGADRQARRELERRIAEFRREIGALPEAPTPASLDRLLVRQAELNLNDDDIAIELEMAEGLRHVLELTEAAAAGSLPIVETTHRVLADDQCYFVAPASRVASDAQQTGKLFLTDRRAIFVSGGVTSLPWTSITRISDDGRDIVFARGGADGLRCRCNSFVDSKRGVFLSRWLRERAR